MTNRTPEEMRALVASRSVSEYSESKWCRLNGITQVEFRDIKRRLRALDKDKNRIKSEWGQISFSESDLKATTSSMT